MQRNDTSISPENKQIARHTAAAFGGAPRVVEYSDDSGALSVGILSSQDRPVDGVTAYATIKLSDHPMQWHDGEFAARIELVGLALSSADYFPNVLVEAAFVIMQSTAVYHPGTVLPDLVRKLHPAALPHLYLTAPFVWADRLNTTLDCGTKKVTWLLAMPISDAEYSYLKQHGEQALEALFAARQLDFADPERESAL